MLKDSYNTFVYRNQFRKSYNEHNWGNRLLTHVDGEPTVLARSSVTWKSIENINSDVNCYCEGSLKISTVFPAFNAFKIDIYGEVCN